MDGARSPRIATTCRVEVVHDGPVLELTNTHLDSTSAERRQRSAEQLIAALDRSVPQIVVGDLNAGPGSAVLSSFAAAGLRDALEGSTSGTFHRFTGRTDGPRIDFVLVDAGIQILDGAVHHRGVGPRLASDHWPVRVTVRFDGGAAL
jgi:endonuclease/exonuclease/phosphatase family metal-dependent hydrolase